MCAIRGIKTTQCLVCVTFKSIFLSCAQMAQIYRHYLMHCAASTHEKKCINAIKKYSQLMSYMQMINECVFFSLWLFGEIFCSQLWRCIYTELITYKLVNWFRGEKQCNIFFALITHFQTLLPCIWVTDSTAIRINTFVYKKQCDEKWISRPTFFFYIFVILNNTIIIIGLSNRLELKAL